VTAITTQGLLDTSIIIALESIPADRLPQEQAISALTLAELAAGRWRPTTLTSGHVARTGCSGSKR
jgi:predicted nucleic acid-binding protein